MIRLQGEYIGIVEPDDFVPLNMYEELYNKAVENDLDLVRQISIDLSATMTMAT
ncbi:MAG: hypothetical protein ACLTDF_05050 [Coprococcus sp.]